jgi:hypothetical protein
MGARQKKVGRPWRPTGNVVALIKLSTSVELIRERPTVLGVVDLPARVSSGTLLDSRWHVCDTPLLNGGLFADGSKGEHGESSRDLDRL